MEQKTDMNDRAEILSRLPFAGLKKETAEALISRSAVYRLDAGMTAETLIKGERAMGILLSGTLTVNGRDGGERMIYRNINEGEAFGAALLFGGEVPFSTVRALKKSVFLLIPESSIKECIRSDGDFALAFAALLCEKLRILNKKLAALSCPDTETVIAKAILGETEEKRRDFVTLESKAHLASRAGISRMTLYRVLDALTKSGAIEVDGNTIRVLDPEKLRTAAGCRNKQYTNTNV